MKLLFLTYDFYPDFGANSVIVDNLAQDFIKNGHEVHILPLKADRTYEKDEVWKGIHIHRITQTHDKSQVAVYLRRLRLISALSLSVSILRDRFNKKEYRLRFWSYYPGKQLRLILAQNEFDIVITVCYPFEACLPIMEYLKKNRKRFGWIIYMQDPFATNYYYAERYSQKELWDFQMEAFSAADKIIVTDLIMKELNEYNCLIPADKFKVLKFPKIIRVQQEAAEDDIELNRHYINCVFAGKFNSYCRNPAYLFQLFDDLKKYPIRLHIIGEEKDGWRQYLPETADNIFFYGERTREAVQNAESNSNILINLGNKVNNMVPSKLFEYISQGKPIVNLYQSEDCPTLTITEKYPLCLDIPVNNTVPDKAVRKLLHFCKRYRKSKVKYKYIEKKYYDCTVEYVSCEFLKICWKLVQSIQIN